MSIKTYMRLPTESISVEELRQNPNAHYHKIYEEDSVPKPKFPFSPNPSNWTKYRESFVLEVLNSIIVGLDGYVIFDCKQVIEETTRQWHHFSDHELFKDEVISEVETIDKTVAVIAASASQCFTHWMLHILPRLKLLIESGLEYDFLYVPRLFFPFQKDTLGFIGVDASKLIEGRNLTCLKASKVIVPSLIDGVAAVKPVWACLFIRNIFLPEGRLNSLRKKRIYISRKISTSEGYRRYVVNEKGVLSFLRTLDFEHVVMEDYSVEEQARLFYNSEIIVAAHGAALTNLIFCQSGTRVIEIFMKRHLCESYYCIGKQFQLDHRCLLSSDELLTEEERIEGDIYIPLDLLRVELEMSLSNG